MKNFLIDIYISNKKIYLINNKKIISININKLSIKNIISVLNIKNMKIDSTSKYKILVIVYDFICKEFSNRITVNYKNKNNKHELYIMCVISFLAESYHYTTYIHPICCPLKNQQKSPFIRFLFVFGPFLNPALFFTHWHLFGNKDEDIDIRFSSRKNLIDFVENWQFQKNKCNNKLLSLAIQGESIPDEELFTVEARKFLGNIYIISIHKTYIQVIYKGDILQIKAEYYKECIFNSNTSFVFVFSYQGKKLVLRARKQDMDIPFLEIMENISGVSMSFDQSPINELWMS